MSHSTSTASILILVTTVALTSAAGASFVAIFSARKYRSVRYLTDLLSQQYGFLRLKYEVFYDIASDGSSKSLITERIRAINIAVAGVEHYSQILTAREGGLAPFVVKPVRLKSEDPKQTSIQVLPKVTLSTEKHLYYQLLYEPMLKPGQEVEYSFEVMGSPRTFAVSQNELFERKLPFDFISMKIAYPTEKFVMKIRFSVDMRVEDLAFDVWLGDARLRLENEYERLKREGPLKFERLDGCQVAQLVVTYPILDLKYVITWRPTKRDEL